MIRANTEHAKFVPWFARAGAACSIVPIARFTDSTALLVDQYAAFIKAPADNVVEESLKHVFAKDRDFQEYLKSPQAQRITPTLRVRRANANDGAEATTKKPVSVAPMAPQTATVAAGSKA